MKLAVKQGIGRAARHFGQPLTWSRFAPMLKAAFSMGPVGGHVKGCEIHA